MNPSRRVLFAYGLKQNRTEQNRTCEKTERTKCVDLNVSIKVQNDLARYLRDYEEDLLSLVPNKTTTNEFV